MNELDHTGPVGDAPHRAGTATADHSVEVSRFVGSVRRRLGDLTEEAGGARRRPRRRHERPCRRARGRALPDPEDYAAELRLAAASAPRHPHATGGARGRMMAWLDRGCVLEQVGRHRGAPRDSRLATTLRPVWWVVRALCATALVTEIYGNQAIYGLTPRRALLAAVLVLVSVQLGRGSRWTGYLLRRSLLLRLLLIGANVLAVVALPTTFNRFLGEQSFADQAYYGAPAYGGASDSLLSFRGNPVRNIYAYDAQGHPLVGVQLVDQDGRRLMAERRTTTKGPVTVPDVSLDERTHGAVQRVPARSAARGLRDGKARRHPDRAPASVQLPGRRVRGRTTPSVRVPPAVVERQRAAAAEKAADAAKAKARKSQQSGGANR